MHPPHEDVKSQIDALDIDPRRPMIITDADEVLVQFVSCLEEYLHERGLYLDLASFALAGNIRRVADHEPVAIGDIPVLLGDFFAARAGHVPAVPGATEALAALAPRARIVILSNIPLEHRAARRAGLKRLGMDYPLIANLEPKGPVVAALARGLNAPVFFIDDLPRNIRSVAEAATAVRRLHFVADPRLAALLEPAPFCHHRSDDWGTARAYIEGELDHAGF